MYHAAKAGIHALSQTNLFGTASGGDMAEAKKRFFYGYEVLQPADIADAIAFAISAPAHVNISNIEIVSTMQVPGGLRFAKSGA